MTREEQIRFCEVCKNRDFHRQHGIVCKLTGEPADFTESCPSFDVDEEELANLRPYGEEELLALKKERAQKDTLYGALWLAGGLFATYADIGYIFWGAIVFGGIQMIRGLSNMG